MSLSGPHFHGFDRLLIEDLKISDDHKLDWATGLLHQFGPRVSPRNIAIWRIEAMEVINPPQIKSENDTMSYIQLSVIRPALTAAIFIRAQHLGLSAADLAQYPSNFYIIDCSTIGGSGRGDFGIARLSDVDCDSDHFAVVIETKRARVCRSNGQDLDGKGHNSVPVLEYLQEWLQRDGYIPMDQSGFPSERKNGAFDWYDQPWQHKIQKFLFQVRSDPIRTSWPLIT
jgi:hypothetical protein